VISLPSIRRIIRSVRYPREVTFTVAAQTV